ncbi:cytochrome P450 [Plectosphaerella cucumerina]|uniref:Cytochrome P450 n=1 Tax=Plectosphaerella cucumerina TaxID=40658 RepID=A0A8K0TLL9_9PEZI|nr:cytochrome P450 [Plectosphaerella cucumerina]
MADAHTLRAQLLESLTPGRVIAGLALFLLGSLAIDYTWKPTYPVEIPMVGHGRGFLPTVRNFLGYMSHYREWIIDGYGKHSKQDRAFIVPAAVARAYDIILPRSQTQWLLDRPDHIVSAHEAHNDVLYADYNFLGRSNSRSHWYNHVVHRSLARHLPTIVPGISEEVVESVDAAFGTDTSGYKTIKLWDAWLRVVPQVTNRMLVGSRICRNEDFNKRMVSFVDAIIINCFILNMVPSLLHPVFGRLVALPNWYHWWKASKHSIPLIEERLAAFEKKDAGDPAYENWTPPEDYVTWSIRLARSEGKPQELDATTISKRLLPLQFAAIHTTVLTGHSVMLDLLTSDPEKKFIEGLREEASRVLAEEGGHWTKNALSRLYRIDSAIRESQRLSNFSATLVERIVIAKEGITNEMEGWHVPQGAYISFNLQGMHHDEDIYPNADQYDAFRFSAPREAYEALPQEKKDPDEGLRLKKLGMVTTSDAHLAFGHGRHACPGRFFVAHELKLVLAHLVLNYDLKPLDVPRPQPQWIGATIIPPVEATIQLKRREGTV